MRAGHAGKEHNRAMLAMVFVGLLLLVSIFTAQATASQAHLSSQGVLSVMAPRLLLSVIGNTGTNLRAEQDAGIGAKVLRISWRDYMPSEDHTSEAYVQSKRAEISELQREGFQVVVDLGLHDPPKWLHKNYANSYYVNQYGQKYLGDGPIDNGEANLVFNLNLRAAAESYLKRIFSDLGTDFVAVRLGGGRWGELTYPPAKYEAHNNCYWGFDANALKQSPVPGWIPGQPAPAQEAARFLNWYLDTLVGFQNWQVSAVRQSYLGTIMMLYPSWGIRPGQLEEAVNHGLRGSTSAEINGEIQRGFDFARQVRAISDAGIVVSTTWLDADSSGDSTADQRVWSPVKYLSSLASSHPLKLQLHGENTGQGDVRAMRASAQQMVRYNLIGMSWYREEELMSGRYATLADYQRIIGSGSALNW